MERSTSWPAWSPRAAVAGCRWDGSRGCAPPTPRQRYGLGATKGALRVGHDADIALVSLDEAWTVRAAESESAQEYTPFEGFDMTARVTDVWLRGSRIVTDGVVTSETGGRYLSRPTA